MAKPRRPRAPRRPVERIKHTATRGPTSPPREQAAFVADDEAAPSRPLPARPVARPAARLEGQGRAGRARPSKCRPCRSTSRRRSTRRRSSRTCAAGRRRRAASRRDLFADFNGLEDDFGKQLEFYQHDQHWTNRLILGDSLLVMTSLAEKERLKGRVQMIYFDPPYGIKFGSNWQVSTRKRDVKDAKAEDLTRAAGADQGVPRHLGARHPLVPDVPARPADRCPRAADRERQRLRADRRRERASRAVRDGRGVRERELLSARSLSRRRRRSLTGRTALPCSRLPPLVREERSSSVKYRQLYLRKTPVDEAVAQYTLA